MPNLSDTALDDMLAAIPDHDQRAIYSRLARGIPTKSVKCMSETCIGRVIGHIDGQGRVTETPPIIEHGLYLSGLEGSRMRLDGNWGFRCYCGNVSILATEEQGIIGPAMPSKADLETVAAKVKEAGITPALPQDGKIQVDGFVIEDL